MDLLLFDIGVADILQRYTISKMINLYVSNDENVTVLVLVFVLLYIRGNGGFICKLFIMK